MDVHPHRSRRMPGGGCLVPNLVPRRMHTGFNKRAVMIRRLCVFLIIVLLSATASAACTSPTGAEGTLNYDFTNHVLNYCNGTSWISAGGSPAGSSGYVQFNNSSSLGGDSNLFWDNTNKRLGIGTTSPGAELQVFGGAVFIGDANSTSNNNLNLSYNGNTGLATFGPNSGGGSTGLAIGTSTAGTYAEKVRIDNAGNVGIGTTSPGHRLQVSADDAFKPNGGSWGNSSDQRLKTNIRPVLGALSKLGELQPVLFDWKNPSLHGGK